MAEKNDDFEVAELDDQDLEEVAGGAMGLDIACKDNNQCPTNSGNCVAGCSCPQ